MFGLYCWVVGVVVILWGYLYDVLGGVFDVVGFVVYVVLCVDLQLFLVFGVDEFVYVGWVVVCFWFGVFGEVDLYWYVGVFQCQVVGLVFFVIGVVQEY